MDTSAQHFFTDIQGLKTHFLRFGASDKKIIFLHGWGGEAYKSFFSLALNLRKKLPDNEIILLDLPGFGFTENPPIEGWETFQYADWLNTFIEQQAEKNNQITFYGHSFGCRVLVRFLEKNPAFNAKIILTGAAGIKLPPTFREKTSKVMAKIIKPVKKIIPRKVRSLLLRKVFKAHDWDKVNAELKPTLTKVLAEPDFREALKSISQKTLLIWGENDQMTTLEAGKIFHQNLPNSQLEVLENGRHGIHHTHQKEIIRLIQNFTNK